VKVWNLNVKRGADGSKHLDIQMHGVIDGGWLDENPVNTAEVIAELQQHLDAKTVGVRINSVGGSAFGGVAMYNALQSHPGEVTCIVEGLAASAASLVAMAGKCVMGPGSMLMIHKPAVMAMGNADDLRKAANALDKIQDALAGIYVAKTGKSLDEVNALLDEETWMTADEAIAAGFADSMGHEEPDGDEDENGEEPAGPEEPTALGDLVVWNEVAFPKAALPERIVAMAKPPKPVPVVAMAAPVVASDVKITVDGAPTPEIAASVAESVRAAFAASPAAPQAAAAVTPIINRAYLAEKHPELVAALLEEGRTAGVAAERARLKAIDELPALGCAALVAAAKYGDQPLEAPALAVQIVKAQKGVGAELMAARALESAPLSNLGAPAPDAATATASEQRLVAAITAGGNARRGVTR